MEGGGTTKVATSKNRRDVTVLLSVHTIDDPEQVMYKKRPHVWEIINVSSLHKLSRTCAMQGYIGTRETMSGLFTDDIVYTVNSDVNICMWHMGRSHLRTTNWTLWCSH